MHINRTGRHSAYAASAADWRRFLSCWYREYGTLTAKSRDISLVKRDVAAKPPELDEHEIREEILIHESRLGFTLPRSYVDFLIAYYPTETALKDVEFLHVSAIDVIEKVFPGWTDSAIAYDADADDVRYFTYGADQVDVTRVRYLENAITIGMHDMDSPFMLVLHPEVLTSDGEMEAEAFFHAGSARTPSFAEMMRYLYFSEVRLPPGAPAISQEMMRGTCADLLPMKGVWWR